MKKTSIFALSLFAGALLCSLAGCSALGSNPYEVAVREENTNITLSQNGSKSQARVMYEEARADGYTGSFVQFLREIGYSADDSFAVNSTLLSAVEVYAGFAPTRYSSGGGVYYSIGSGVILDLDKNAGDAYVVTNYHILYNADSNGDESIPHVSDDITLYLYGSETEARAIRAEYVGGTMDFDIAVLRVEGSEALKESDARAAAVGDSDEVRVGERVYAVGNPDNKGISAVEGILSVDAEYITVVSADGQKGLTMLEMRTDAPVNHGNSGGGLYNAQGELIGIVNARSEESGVEHLGYAIPSDLACAVAENIIDNSKADRSHGAMRATLGVTVRETDSHSVYEEETGRAKIVETITVEEVGRGIAYGQIKTGDIIRSVRINDGAEKQITRLHMLGNTMFRVRKGDTVTFTLERGGNTVTVALVFSSNNDFSLYK